MTNKEREEKFKRFNNLIDSVAKHLKIVEVKVKEIYELSAELKADKKEGI